MMQRTTGVGLRVFVLCASPAVAVLAVATDTPAVMLLLGVPGALVAYVLHIDRHGSTHQAPVVLVPSRAGDLPDRPGAWLVLLSHPLFPDPEVTLMDEITAGRHQARLLRRALRRIGCTDHRLWLRYLSHGGLLGELEIEAYLHDSLRLPASERDRLVRAANALLHQHPDLQVQTTNELLTRPRVEGPHRDRHD